MGLNLISLRASMYKITGTDDDDVSEIDVDGYLNRSLWEVMAKFKFREKERAVTFAILAGQDTYDVPDPFEALKSIGIIDVNGQSHYIDRITSEWYQETLNTNTNTAALPEKYFRENSVITLYPTPDVDYTGTLRYNTTLADLSDSNTGLEIPQEWHEIVLFGGAWRLLLELGDFTRANALKKSQVELINSSIPTDSKEETDSRHAGVNFIGSKYEL